jgi:predicted ATPase/DNA-binding winged helix-turn-helix (wHTH) protein
LNFRYKNGTEEKEHRMSSDPLILFPPFRLDIRNEQLWRGDELVSVRPKPFAVLAYLAAHPGRLVTAVELRKAIWPTTYVGEGLLRGYIREVRIALGDDPEAPRFIETAPRRGYRFLPAVSASAPIGRKQNAERSLPLLPFPPTADRLLPTVLVGRERELAQLHRWFDTAMSGARQVVFVTGEPGIGKTTLVDAFLAGIGRQGTDNGEQARRKSKGENQKAKIGDDSLASSLQPLPSVLIGRGQCIEHYGSGEAYLPVLEALGRLCRQPGGEQVIALLSRYAPTWLVQMPALVSDPELEALQHKVQGATRERMLREMAEALEALTAEYPLVLVLEDVHWSDYSTLDLFALLAQRRGAVRFLLLATYRPTDVIVSGHPLKALKQELQVHGQCEKLPLGFLTVAEVHQYLAAKFPQQQFPAELGRVLYHSTEGNPLFMVNVVDEWVRQGMLVEMDGQWQLTGEIHELAAGVPESLRQLIEKHLAQLTPEERRVVEAASVVGGEFTTAAVAAGIEEQEGRVEEWCEGLAVREQFVRARGTETFAEGMLTGCYGFLHALYQQVLYERLAPVRRIYLHRRIGEWEERVYGPRVSEVAAELAMHFERGQDYERAVRHLAQAGQNALRRSAPQEAISLLTKGLELLMTLPETPARAHHELALQATLGATLAVTKGYAAPEVQHAQERAFLLCQQMGDVPQLFPVLAGLWGFRFLRAELHMAKELATQLFRLVQPVPDPALLVWAHTLQGLTLSTLGELSTALRQLEQGITLYDPKLHRPDRTQVGAQDPKVTCLSYAAWTLWRLGYPDQARQRMEEALSFAQELSHPFSLAFTLDFAEAGVGMFLRTVPVVHTHAEMLMKLCHEQGFPYWLGWGMVRQGWVLVEQGQAEAGIAKMRQGMATVQITGAELSMSYILAQLAEAYGKVGQEKEGLSLLAEALARVEKTGERWYEAELWRLKGELLLQQGHTSRSQLQPQRRPKSKVLKSSRANL